MGPKGLNNDYQLYQNAHISFEVSFLPPFKTFYLNSMAPELGLSKSQKLDAVCGSLYSLLNGQRGSYTKYLHLRTGKNRLHFSSTLNLNCWTTPPTLPKPLLSPQQGFKAHPFIFIYSKGIPHPS